tara:strand:+ start:452 stop:913 length:462 start_codon:yes stop_codon:yes gene_type:complete
MRFISKHISWTESIRSKTAEKKEIANVPKEVEIVAMKKVSREIFEPLRAWAKEPIRVNSFYRSKELCEAIGSKATSQHTKGQAIDIDATGKKTNADLFNYIKDNLKFDQLIWEFGDDENPDWIHVSFVGLNGNRNKILKAVKKSKKTSYQLYV